MIACNGCTACCKATPSLVLHPELGDDPALYETTQDGSRLAPNGTGACRYLGETGCTIYDKRPATCRNMDCRRLLKMPEKYRLQRIRQVPGYAAVFKAARDRKNG